jgi:hypothetical protein
VGARVKPGGDLEITLGVQPGEKWEAFKLSDTAGLMLSVDVYRQVQEEEDNG